MTPAALDAQTRAMPPTLETSRLILRPIELADAEQVQPLFANWEIVRFLGSRVPWPCPADSSLRFIRDDLLPRVEKNEAWGWSLRLKTQPAQVIGMIDLRIKGTDGDENDNRGFWLGLAWQRQGLMTEACDAVTDYWFEVLKMPVLRVPKAAANIASRRISEKQGMRMIASFEKEFRCGRMPAELWEITADEWRARKEERPRSEAAR